jgi:transcriptional regulator with XRE-family HTH domain
MYKHFGEKLCEERKKQGLTVNQVAVVCGTSRSYITLIETGKRQPGKKVIPKIAVALKLKVEVVLNWYLEDIQVKFQRDFEGL